MKSKFLFLTILLLSVFLIGGNAVAYDFGTQISIYDKQGTGTGWHGANEDNEVEPDSAIGQQWDLEGMFIDGTNLTIVGGWDFNDGVGSWDSGDIYIDTDGGALYGEDAKGLGPAGNGVQDVKNVYGYDYVLDINWGAESYNIFGIGADSNLLTTHYQVNDGSNPYKFKDNGTSNEGSGTFSQKSYLTGDADTPNFLGYGLNETHYYVTFDMDAIIGPGDGFLAHFTQKGGNDNLIGAVPEPTTILLSGLGLLGMTAYLRRKYTNKA